MITETERFQCVECESYYETEMESIECCECGQCIVKRQKLKDIEQYIQEIRDDFAPDHTPFMLDLCLQDIEDIIRRK